MMLEGKIALVTGPCDGIGRAIVKRFTKEGATVYAADLTPQGSLAEHDDDGASDEARYASGQLWRLDGGLSAQVQQMKL